MVNPSPTTSTERCDRSELPADQCGGRKHRPDGGQLHVEAAVARGTGHTYMPGSFPARYGGTCPECRERYEPGELITAQRFRSISSNTGRYAHVECAEEAS